MTSENNLPPKTFWRVEPRIAAGGRKDIVFRVVKPDCPADQVELKVEVEKTLTVINAIYNEDPGKLSDYFDRLLALAQVGLVGENASAGVARAALISLQREILLNEEGRIKNQYMKKLGLSALKFATFSLLAVAFIVYYRIDVTDDLHSMRFLPLVWVGTAAGVWASFAARNVTIGFFSLPALEEDKLEPAIRLAFSCILSTILVLAFEVKIITVIAGAFNSSEVLRSGGSSLLVGALAGIAEKALPSAVTRAASDLVQRVSSSNR